MNLKEKLKNRVFVSPKEGWEILQVGRSTFYKLLARNEIPHIRVRGQIRIPTDGLLKWIRDHAA